MTPTGTRLVRALVLAAAASLAGCTHTVKVEPIRVEPIDITLHIYLEADEKLDSFFNFQDKPAEPPPAPPAASPGPTEGGSS